MWRTARILWFGDVPWFDGGATNAPPYRGVAEKGSSNRRESDLAMNCVWEQSKSNVFKPFQTLVVYWKSQSELFSCTDQSGDAAPKGTRGEAVTPKMRGH